MAFACPFYFAVVCIATFAAWSKSSPAPPQSKANDVDSNLVKLKQVVQTADYVLVNDSQLIIMHVGNTKFNNIRYAYT